MAMFIQVEKGGNSSGFDFLSSCHPPIHQNITDSPMATLVKSGNSKPCSPTKGLFDKPVLVVAIAGGTGSGKTSVANAIRKSIG
jgi:ABC-type multidrug transport system fused ATPase/permease subunit